MNSIKQVKRKNAVVFLAMFLPHLAANFLYAAKLIDTSSWYLSLAISALIFALGTLAAYRRLQRAGGEGNLTAAVTISLCGVFVAVMVYIYLL
ncbi:MAG: hypothetical protein EAY75_16385 [Bacteroidetes bacterium]|nr:MAG: hypothetical protein EAY75_16385 [Bacteroidota bacterium]